MTVTMMTAPDVVTNPAGLPRLPAHDPRALAEQLTTALVAFATGLVSTATDDDIREASDIAGTALLLKGAVADLLAKRASHGGVL